MVVLVLGDVRLAQQEVQVGAGPYVSSAAAACSRAAAGRLLRRASRTAAAAASDAARAPGSGLGSSGGRAVSGMFVCPVSRM
ncbi:hypothetical protein [Streptomyces sp. SID4913]|uniref:hypothetical protein n=1 Tax=Streptomyces sp. SID4913 TaxID=2690266 RepID=UPI00036002B0|nr:hypothetical protein [Streptomyces sp. SID4913]